MHSRIKNCNRTRQAD